MSPNRLVTLSSKAASRGVKPYAKNMNEGKRIRMSVKSLLNEEGDASEEDVPLRLTAGAAMSGSSVCADMSSTATQDQQTLDGEPRDHPGMPTHDKFLKIVDEYLASLHERKKDKALITQEMHEMIYDTLLNPDSTRLGTPQFRFWARKMFKFVDLGSGEMVITHEGRPVAVKEHIYDILCMCHGESQHAGRDKTCKVIREYYTWIPKELTANFVKMCPTCVAGRPGVVRGGSVTGCSSSLVEKAAQLEDSRSSYASDSPTAEVATPSVGFFPAGSPNDARYQVHMAGRETRSAAQDASCSTSTGAKLELPGLHSEDLFSPGHRSITSPHLYLPASGCYEDEYSNQSTATTADFTKLPRLVGAGGSGGSYGYNVSMPLPPLMQFLSDFSASNMQTNAHQQMQYQTLQQAHQYPHGQAYTPLPPLMKYLQNPVQITKPSSHSMTLPPIQVQDTASTSSPDVGPDGSSSNTSKSSFQIPIDPVLLSCDSASSHPQGAGNGSQHTYRSPQMPLSAAEAVITSLQLQILPPTPLKLQNASGTMPDFAEMDPDAEFGFSGVPTAAQILAGMARGSAASASTGAGGNPGIGLGFGRTCGWGPIQESAPADEGYAQEAQRAYGSFSGTSWSSGSSEAGTPLSATFPPGVQGIPVGVASGGGEAGCEHGHGSSGRYGYGLAYRYEDTPLGLTLPTKVDKGKGNVQKRLKID